MNTATDRDRWEHRRHMIGETQGKILGHHRGHDTFGSDEVSVVEKKTVKTELKV